MLRRDEPSPPLPDRVIVQFVRPDGTYILAGVRVRCAPGVEVGSLRDEMESGAVTPLAPGVRSVLRLNISDCTDLIAYVDSLPEAIAADG
ncbi:MAG: hypothetical protein JKX88_10125 [Marinicaulis sp.]|nr:hypothetical protein [Marinicaulis sp.]